MLTTVPVESTPIPLWAKVMATAAFTVMVWQAELDFCQLVAPFPLPLLSPAYSARNPYVPAAGAVNVPLKVRAVPDEPLKLTVATVVAPAWPVAHEFTCTNVTRLGVLGTIVVAFTEPEKLTPACPAVSGVVIAFSVVVVLRLVASVNAVPAVSPEVWPVAFK